MSTETFFPITDASFGSELSPEAFDLLAGQYLAALGPHEATVRPEITQSKEVRRRKFLAALVAGVQTGVEAGGTTGAQQLSASWNDPVNKTYWLINRTDRAYTINRISAQLTSGTCTAQLHTGAGNIGSAVSCSTVQTSSVVSLAIPAGDFLKVTLSSVVGAADLCLTLDYE